MVSTMHAEPLTNITPPEHWSQMITVNSGESLAKITENQPVLLVFLRHFGCSFCREAISDISKQRKKFEKIGVRVVFVHMAPEPSTAEVFFKKYKIFPVDHIHDPEKVFYRAFGLGKTSGGQLLGLMNWIRGFEASVIEGHGFSHNDPELGNDDYQLPGVFVLFRGEVKNSFIHRHAYDRPDYESFVLSCSF